MTSEQQRGEAKGLETTVHSRDHVSTKDGK
jgi:hypothetical protein